MRCEPPPEINAVRRQTPSHLALLLVIDKIAGQGEVIDNIVDIVQNAARWCRAAGISDLTVYDDAGGYLSQTYTLLLTFCTKA